MPGNYWIKLYIEVLDDSKMATLPDRLWRRVIELFMLAGRYYKNGELPDTNELAWVLRVPMDELDLDLKQIQQTGIIDRIENGWMVVKFAKRQAKMTDAEKMKLHRDRQHREQYYGEEVTGNEQECVTLSNASVTQITDNRLTDNRLTDTDRETDASLSLVIDSYKKYIGKCTPIMENILGEALKTYPAEWFDKAFEIAAGSGRKRWDYSEGILKNWKTTTGPPGKNGRDRITAPARNKYAELPK